MKRVVEQSDVISVDEVSEFKYIGFAAVYHNDCRLLVGSECGRFGWRLVGHLAGTGSQETFSSRKNAILEAIQTGATVYLFKSVADLKEVLP